MFVLVASGVRSRADVERCVKAIVLGGAVVAFCAIVETRTGYNVFNHMRTVFPFLQDTGERASEVRNGALRAEASAQHPIALGVALSLCLPLSLALVTRVTARSGASSSRRRAPAHDRHGRDDLAHRVPGARRDADRRPGDGARAGSCGCGRSPSSC